MIANPRITPAHHWRPPSSAHKNPTNANNKTPLILAKISVFCTASVTNATATTSGNPQPRSRNPNMRIKIATAAMIAAALPQINTIRATATCPTNARGDKIMVAPGL